MAVQLVEFSVIDSNRRASRHSNLMRRALPVINDRCLAAEERRDFFPNPSRLRNNMMPVSRCDEVGELFASDYENATPKSGRDGSNKR